jgi:cytoskeletal protein CcmA (bactofilin family)
MATSGRTRRWPILVGLVVLAIPAAALAQQQVLGGKFRTGREVIVPEGETVSGDLYASAGTVQILGAVEGDLVATGGEVQMAGNVGGDVIVGAGTVDISGQVMGDVRAGAGRVFVSGAISEDLLVGSGELTISSSGQVGEDLVFGTGRTTLDGAVTGDILGGTSSYVRRGTVGGTEDVTIGERGERAEPTAGDRLLDAVRRFIALLAVGALLLWLAPWSVAGPAGTLRGRPWVSLGIGLLGFIGIVAAFFAIILAMILLTLLFGLVGLSDLVGLSVVTGIAAMLVLFFLVYVTFGFLAQLAVALMIGRLAVRGESTAARWGALALGVLVVVVLTSLPAVGSFLTFVVLAFGLGAMLVSLFALRRRAAATPLPPPPAASVPS